MRPHTLRQSKWSLSGWIWVCYWFVLFIMTHIPLRSVGLLARPHADKAVHVTVYFLLVWLGARHRRVSGRSGSIAALLGWAFVYAVYAALDELLQSYVGRTMSLGDWMADMAGIAAATAIVIFVPPPVGLSERGGESKT